MFFFCQVTGGLRWRTFVKRLKLSVEMSELLTALLVTIRTRSLWTIDVKKRFLTFFYIPNVFLFLKNVVKV